MQALGDAKHLGEAAGLEVSPRGCKFHLYPYGLVDLMACPTGLDGVPQHYDTLLGLGQCLCNLHFSHLSDVFNFLLV